MSKFKNGTSQMAIEDDMFCDRSRRDIKQKEIRSDLWEMSETPAEPRDCNEVTSIVNVTDFSRYQSKKLDVRGDPMVSGGLNPVRTKTLSDIPAPTAPL